MKKEKISYEVALSTLQEKGIEFPSVFQHFKGDFYVLKSLALGTEDKVVYCIYTKNGITYARPFSMFFEDVSKPSYEYIGPRFKFIKNGDTVEVNHE